MNIILKSILSFFKDNGPLLAGSIAYFFLMSFVPFCLFLITIFGYILGGDQEFYAFFLNRLIRLFPAATSDISHELAVLVAYRKIGIVTFMIYVYFSYQLYLALQTAMHLIFREPAEKLLLITIVRSLIIVTLIVVFIAISFTATSAIQMLRPMITTLTGIRIGMFTGLLIRFLIPLVLVFLITTTLYIFLPAKRANFGNALQGALFTTVFLEAARHLFTFYAVTAASSYGALYGSLSSLVIFLLWVYLSACIFLVGAEIVCHLQVSRRVKS